MKKISLNLTIKKKNQKKTSSHIRMQNLVWCSTWKKNTKLLCRFFQDLPNLYRALIIYVSPHKPHNPPSSQSLGCNQKISSTCWYPPWLFLIDITNILISCRSTSNTPIIRNDTFGNPRNPISHSRYDTTPQHNSIHSSRNSPKSATALPLVKQLVDKLEDIIYSASLD